MLCKAVAAICAVVIRERYNSKGSCGFAIKIVDGDVTISPMQYSGRLDRCSSTRSIRKKFPKSISKTSFRLACQMDGRNRPPNFANSFKSLRDPPKVCLDGFEFPPTAMGKPGRSVWNGSLYNQCPGKTMALSKRETISPLRHAIYLILRVLDSFHIMLTAHRSLPTSPRPPSTGKMTSGWPICARIQMRSAHKCSTNCSKPLLADRSTQRDGV